VAGGLDVLVDVAGVVPVVAVLDLGEPVVVAALGGFDPVLALAHQEADVAGDDLLLSCARSQDLPAGGHEAGRGHHTCVPQM
jgi:molybdate-binding protein